jgi:hypothetical protein
MERKRYLELCQKSAAGHKSTVVYNGVDYQPKSYELSFDNSGNPVHIAILKDEKANSVICVKLKDVFDEGGKDNEMD